MSVQTYDLFFESDNTTTLYCWQDSAKNVVSTQTSISLSSPLANKIKIIKKEVPRKSSVRSVAVGPDIGMRNGFQMLKETRHQSEIKEE